MSLVCSVFVFVNFHVVVCCPCGLFVDSQCDVYTMPDDIATDSQSIHRVMCILTCSMLVTSVCLPPLNFFIGLFFCAQITTRHMQLMCCMVCPTSSLK